ncbi:conserved unknown protein [Ectocarpus siliculosus]|uniref:TBC1 domain family member 23 n=1 Tax=Ectocarpus siliculosus TaxID=2880 RepID=D8LN81_ECTSI|nr:conserved unknown protein [Ectocarpus siliculosus]|eukprot:CBN74844.1 conserved unknown protein [Ectocarpus siliculosus]
MFKREEVMQLVSQVLERYCVGHGIRYKQGQNELIAPFVMLQDPPLPVPVLGLMFESFMSRFVSRWFVDDEIEALLVSYRVFRVLLFYVDPGLARKLDEADFVPELYATAWLITLFSRNLTMELVVRLWDVYLAVNDPSLVFFLLAALLVRNRQAIIASDRTRNTILGVDQAHMMPEMIQSLTVTDKEDLEELIVQAREMLRKVPESFLQTVRSCCSDQCNVPLDTSRSLFCESVRCVSIGPGELLDRMARRSPGDGEGGGGDGREGTRDGKVAAADGNRSPCPMRPGAVDTVALDIRPLHDYENSGAGHLGKSLRLDPYLLEMEDVLEKWMQHFDGTRGTHVCLVDSLDPSTGSGAYGSSSGGGHGDEAGGRGGQQQQQQKQRREEERRRGGSEAAEKDRAGREVAAAGAAASAGGRIIEDPLWRRLLFGEGDPITAGGREGNADAPDWECQQQQQQPEQRQPSDGSDRASRGGGSGVVGVVEGGPGEGFGAAKAFARRLHARGFPYVSILEGGMEGIVQHLKKEGIPLEPTVIDHDPEAYQRWREAQARRLAAALPPEGQRRESASRAGEAFSWREEGDGKTGDNSNSNSHYSGSSSASHQNDGRQHQREEYGGGGGGGAEGGGGVETGQSKVGVLDRLGLVRVRDGVSHGVGTVARTGAWAVRGGAGMIIPSALSADSGDMVHQQEREEGRFRGQTAPRGHARTESGNIWEDEEGADGGGGGGLNNLMNGGLVDSNDVQAILGAVKTAQAGVRDGISRGVGTVRRTGSWVAREGGIAGRGATPPPAPASIDGGNNPGGSSGDGAGRAQRLRPRSGTGSGQVGEGASEDDVDEENEEAALLVALKTAEANGHTAVAKVLRGRLGFLQGQAVRLRLARKEDSGGGGGGGSGPAPSSDVQPPYEDSPDLASTPVRVD